MRAIVDVHELRRHLLDRQVARPPPHFGHRRPAAPECRVVQTGVTPRRAEDANGFSLPHHARRDTLEGGFLAPDGWTLIAAGTLIIVQMIREKKLGALHRGVD